ncbi:MAG: ABC transporter permease [Roseibacillus sp.]|nr:ABC transporter permease [Roseibacillus sp.]
MGGDTMLGEEGSCQQDLAIKGVARVPVLLESASMIEIPLWRLGLSLIPILLVGWISFRWGGGAGSLSVATGRMVLQLFAIGYVLSFLFGIQSPWVTLGVVSFMILISAWISIRTVRERRWASYRDALLAIGVGGGLIYLLVIFGVIAVEPWYEPKYAISLSGMVFANAMTAVTLSAERFDAERMSGKSAVHARNTAWNAALIPQINTFLAVGLVALPGIMTGQVIAGANPMEAVRYQIMVMSMVMGSAGFAVAIFLSQRVRSLAISGEEAERQRRR